MANSTSFDPFAQSFTLLMQDGTPFKVYMPDLEGWIRYEVQSSINFAVQLGASIILLIVVLLLTKADKRRSAMFLFNVLALTLNIIRTALTVAYFTSHWVELYAFLGNDFSRVTRSDYANSVAAIIISTILLMCVEISLIIQMRVVCVTLRTIYREALTFFTVIAALVAFGFRLALCIMNIKLILLAAYEGELAWIQSAANISFTVAICCVCAVFICKLGLALHQRRKLGMNQFGPMQIILIMGGQTLIIPGMYSFSLQYLDKANVSAAIFSILQYYTNVPELSSNVLTLVTIFLPLSSLWASANVLPQGGQLMGRRTNRFFASPQSNVTSQGPVLTGTAGDYSNGPSSPAFTADTAIGSGSPPSPSRTEKMYGDLEAQGMHGMDHFFGTSRA